MSAHETRLKGGDVSTALSERPRLGPENSDAAAVALNGAAMTEFASANGVAALSDNDPLGVVASSSLVEFDARSEFERLSSRLMDLDHEPGSGDAPKIKITADDAILIIAHDMNYEYSELTPYQLVAVNSLLEHNDFGVETLRARFAGQISNDEFEKLKQSVRSMINTVAYHLPGRVIQTGTGRATRYRLAKRIGVADLRSKIAPSKPVVEVIDTPVETEHLVDIVDIPAEPEAPAEVVDTPLEPETVPEVPVKLPEARVTRPTTLTLVENHALERSKHTSSRAKSIRSDIVAEQEVKLRGKWSFFDETEKMPSVSEIIGRMAPEAAGVALYVLKGKKFPEGYDLDIVASVQRSLAGSEELQDPAVRERYASLNLLRTGVVTVDDLGAGRGSETRPPKYGAGNVTAFIVDRTELPAANCRGSDPDLFFPERGGSTREAKEVCRDCSVREECLEIALANKEKFGIWGGLSERERRRIRRQRVQARKAAEPVPAATDKAAQTDETDGLDQAADL